MVEEERVEDGDEEREEEGDEEMEEEDGVGEGEGEFD